MTGDDRSALAVLVRARPALSAAELIAAAADVGLVLTEAEIEGMRQGEAPRAVPPVPKAARKIRGRGENEPLEAYILRIGGGLRPYEVVKTARMDGVKVTVADVRRARGDRDVDLDEGMPAEEPSAMQLGESPLPAPTTSAPPEKAVGALAVGDGGSPDHPPARARRVSKTSAPVPAAPTATTVAESTMPEVGTRSRKAKTAVDARGSQRDWRALVNEARGAGIAAIAQLHGVNPKTLRWWKWRLSASETGTSRKRAASATTEAQVEPAAAKPRRTASTRTAADADVEAALRAGLARLILEHGTTRSLELFHVVVERMREAAK